MDLFECMHTKTHGIHFVLRFFYLEMHLLADMNGFATMNIFTFSRWFVPILRIEVKTPTDTQIKLTGTEHVRR